MSPTTPTTATAQEQVSPRWKGKARALAAPTVIEGSGGNDGVVIPMLLVGDGVYEVAYVISIQVGRQSNPRTFSLQVDTGSSDLWIAASSCSTSSCGHSGSLYNPGSSGANATGTDFAIDYLQGHVDGPVYWDKVTIGGYSIENQALAAGTTVNNEPLTSNFNGILGLALPMNSVIAQSLPPVTTNDPDGAAWASNLFSITPTINAPALRFISMTISRPGSDHIPSVLGIGRHPSGVASAAQSGGVQYATLVAERTGTLFWKMSLRGITVYQDGVRKPILLGRGVMGSVYPTAVLDSGVPLILTSSTIANAIYGALGVNPAVDGQYYVPCDMPLNMTITLDDRTEIPLHPLDVTADPPGDNQSAFCVGIIQGADAQLGVPNNIGDMILGVPFLRNVYSVMAYSEPNSDGSFPVAGESGAQLDLEPSPSNSTTGTLQSNSTASASIFIPTTVTTTSATMTAVAPSVTPRLGLLALTDPTTALAEFRTVRILKQPITNSYTGSNNGKNSLNAQTDRDGRKLTVGVIVLISLVGFIALCAGLFAVRWWLLKRKYRRKCATGTGVGTSPWGSGANTPRAGEGAGASLDTDVSFLSNEDGGRQHQRLAMLALEMGVGGGYGFARGMGKTSAEAVGGNEARGATTTMATIPAYSGAKGLMDMDGQNAMSASMLRMEGGYEDVWDPHTSVAMSWPSADTMSLCSRKIPHRLRNDSSILPLHHHQQCSFDDNDEVDRAAPFHTRSESQEREVESAGVMNSATVPLLDHPPQSYDITKSQPLSFSLPTRQQPPLRSYAEFVTVPQPLDGKKVVGDLGQVGGGGGEPGVMMTMMDVGAVSRTKKIGVDGEGRWSGGEG